MNKNSISIIANSVLLNGSEVFDVRDLQIHACAGRHTRVVLTFDVLQENTLYLDKVPETKGLVGDTGRPGVQAPPLRRE